VRVSLYKPNAGSLQRGHLQGVESGVLSRLLLHRGPARFGSLPSHFSEAYRATVIRLIVLYQFCVGHPLYSVKAWVGSSR
jgi:hypothetical protein